MQKFKQARVNGGSIYDSLNEAVENNAGKATDMWFSVNNESTAVARQKHAPCQAAGPGSISGRDKFPE